jgi:hypothetical protein
LMSLVGSRRCRSHCIFISADAENKKARSILSGPVTLQQALQIALS